MADKDLWQAVINQTFLEAASACRFPLTQEVVQDARDWLLTDIEDFYLVCDYAGVDPDYIRLTALTLAARDWTITVH